MYISAPKRQTPFPFLSVKKKTTSRWPIKHVWMMGNGPQDSLPRWWPLFMSFGVTSLSKPSWNEPKTLKPYFSVWPNATKRGFGDLLLTWSLLLTSCLHGWCVGRVLPFLYSTFILCCGERSLGRRRLDTRRTCFRNHDQQGWVRLECCPCVPLLYLYTFLPLVFINFRLKMRRVE